MNEGKKTPMIAITSGLEEFLDDLQNDRPLQLTRFYHDGEGDLCRERVEGKLEGLFDEPDTTMGKG